MRIFLYREKNMNRRLSGAAGLLLTALLLCSLTGCAASAAEGRWSAEEIAVLDGFKTPESVLPDPDSGAAYVSNIVRGDVGAWGKDGVAYISKIVFKDDKPQLAMKWRESEPGSVFNGPKGMCLLNGYLYATDVDAIIRISLKDKKVERIPVEGSQKLNDMATDGKNVWFTENGLPSKVYCYDGEKLRSMPAPDNVNGLTFHDGKLFVVSSRSGDIYEMDPKGEEEPKPFGLGSHFTALDGIETLEDGAFIVSDNPGGKVCTIAPDRKSVATLLTMKNPADIGVDVKNHRLYVPQLTQDTVRIYKLEKKQGAAGK